MFFHNGKYNKLFACFDVVKFMFIYKYNDRGSKKTIISKEYSSEWKKGEVPYYPVNNSKNNSLYEKYKSIENDKVIWCGRCGLFKYLDMDDTIELTLNMEI